MMEESLLAEQMQAKQELRGNFIISPTVSVLFLDIDVYSWLRLGYTLHAQP